MVFDKVILMELKQTGAGRYGMFGKRASAFLVLFVLTFLMYADGYRQNDIIINQDSVVNSTLLATQTSRQDENNSAYALANLEVGEIFVRGQDRLLFDENGNPILDEEIAEAYEAGFVYEEPNVDFDLEAYKTAQENRGQMLRQLTLDDLIPRPKNPDPGKINLLVYPKYNIRVPIVYTEPADFYYKKSDGSIDYSRPIDPSKLSAYESTQIPIQVKLRDGVVHLSPEIYPTSVMPGEVGNAYIVGHSSNYNWVQSNYNEIFKPIEKRSQPGEQFVIYDRFGRELKFKVFETKLIEHSNTKEAYKLFDYKRVVTLQTSVLTWNNGVLEPTHRWLTRGELVLD
jgi:hypothetical protein